jgi:hypothetical protein
MSGVMNRIAIYRIMPALMLAAACGAPAQPEPQVAATAAIMTQVQAGAPLQNLLEMMEEHLALASEGRMEGQAVVDFRRAEAISDRLLEARLPFEWIAEEQYSVGARLRQIQSKADRVLAMLETGVPRDSVLAELELLRGQVARMQETIAQGGTQAPPHIHLLLQGGDTAGAGARRQFQQQQQQQQQPQPPQGPRPIGAPVGGN